MWHKTIVALLALASLCLLAHRIWRATTADHVSMPVSNLSSDEVRLLYLTPGGSYTLADIAANGRTTPGEKYRTFQARHDLNPQPGDALCPITRTKASRDCTWIIAGREYAFCCPPCIDEFLRAAKTQATLPPPEVFISR